MNIYETGEEKCIDGVWGREVNGRFYNLIVQEDKLGRFLDIDINPAKLVQSLAVLMEHNGFTNYNYEEAVNSSMLFYKHYKPRHIEDLKNLKQGDVVWVKIPSDSLPSTSLWVITRFIGMRGSEYLCSNLYNEAGQATHYNVTNHLEVSLKPPFNF